MPRGRCSRSNTEHSNGSITYSHFYCPACSHTGLLSVTSARCRRLPYLSLPSFPLLPIVCTTHSTLLQRERWEQPQEARCECTYTKHRGRRLLQPSGVTVSTIPTTNVLSGFNCYSNVLYTILASRLMECTNSRLILEHCQILLRHCLRKRVEILTWDKKVYVQRFA